MDLFGLIGDVRRALSLVWRSNPRLMLWSIFLDSIVAVLPLVAFYITKLVIDQLVAGLHQVGQMDPLFWIMIGTIGLVWFLTSAIGSINTWVQELLELHFHDDMTRQIQAHSLQMDLAYYENPDLQDTLHKTQYESAFRPLQLLRSLHQLIQALVFLVAVSGLLFSYTWWLLPVLALAAIPGLWIKLVMDQRFYLEEKSRITQEREGWYLHDLMTKESAAKEVRTYDLGPFLSERFTHLRKEILKAKSRLLSRRVTLESIAHLLEVGALLGLLIWVAKHAISGFMSIGTLVLMLQVFQRGQSQIRLAFSGLGGILTHRLFLRYLFEFLDQRPGVSEPILPVCLPERLSTGLKFQNVFFTYPGNHTLALDGIDLELQIGERIAIVGPNGSGKSTLIKLISRLYDPTSGDILIDDIDIKDCRIEDIRRASALVFQDDYHFPFNVTSTIHLGAIQKRVDQEQICRSIEISGAKQFVDQLPEKENTFLGHAWRSGSELSGGQWQQIAIARALYADRSILILDEPMSAIDPLIEAYIYEQLFQMERNNLILFVTHRLYHLQKADRIIVMDKGRVVEQGSFADLMSKQGLFSQMFASQQIADLQKPISGEME